jgi:hypothetical protein
MTCDYEINEFKKSDPGEKAEILKQTDDREKDEYTEKRFFRCSVCNNIITSDNQRFEVEGLFEHTFTNPGGFTYRVGCFRTAPGCVTEGDPTMEYTWFAGFSWRHALCGNCLFHIGWFYESEGSSFFGLIMDNIVMDE